jgi:glucokinase
MRRLSETAPSLGAGPAVLAFDVGGTDMKSALVDSSGRVLGLRRSRTPLDGDRTPEAIVRRASELAAELAANHPEHSPVAAGLIVPGIVDPHDGVAVYSSNLGWRNAPLRTLAERALGLPVAFHHDVTAASLAEHRLGAASRFDDVVVLIIGTGIAGSLILGGRPHIAGGYAGEFGPSPVAETPDCVGGARGCLEAIASAGAIARRYTEQSGSFVVGAREVIDLASAGDSTAREIWESALDALALSVSQIAATIAPDAILIGGGLSRAGDDLFVPVAARMDARLSFHRRPLLIPAQLGDDAGLLGAALVARERAVA